MAGTEYRYNARQDQANLDLEVYLDDRQSSYLWALYAQDEFSHSR